MAVWVHMGGPDTLCEVSCHALSSTVCRAPEHRKYVSQFTSRDKSPVVFHESKQRYHSSTVEPVSVPPFLSTVTHSTASSVFAGTFKAVEALQILLESRCGHLTKHCGPLLFFTVWAHSCAASHYRGGYRCISLTQHFL